MDVKLYVFFIIAALGGAVWVFVGRSGHTAGVPVPGFELMLRRFLENTMYARPREKEFIIGHPALMLATFAFMRKWPTVIIIAVRFMMYVTQWFQAREVDHE